MAEKVVTSIEVKFSDGTMLRSTGELSDAIWKWWLNCEIFVSVHGHYYTGKQMEEVTYSPLPTGEKK